MANDVSSTFTSECLISETGENSLNIKCMKRYVIPPLVNIKF